MDKRHGIRRDFTNLKVGNLSILRYANKRGTAGSIWEAVCVCGEPKLVTSRSIRRAMIMGYAISCNKCDVSPRKIDIPLQEIAF